MYKRRKCACCFPPCPPAISIGTPKRERTCRYVLSYTVKEEKELLDKVSILFFRRIAHFIFIRLHLSYSLHFIWVKVTEIITRLMYFIYKYKSAIYLCGCLLFLWYLKKESETAQLIGSPPVWVDVRHSSISIPSAVIIEWRPGKERVTLAAGSINWWIQQHNKSCERVKETKKKVKM